VAPVASRESSGLGDARSVSLVLNDRRRDDGPVKPEHEDLLRRLALNDEGALESLFGAGFADAQRSELDAKALALVRLAGLVVLESAPASYQWTVAAALAAGATDEEIVGVLAALVPIAGAVRVGSAAPEVALAMGCDLGLGDNG